MLKSHYKDYQIDYRAPTVRLSLVFELATLHHTNLELSDWFRVRQQFLKSRQVSVFEILFCEGVWLKLKSYAFDRIMGHAIIKDDLITNAPELHAREILCRKTYPHGRSLHEVNYGGALALHFEAWEKSEPLIKIGKYLPKEYRILVRKEVDKLQSERSHNIRKNIRFDEYGEPVENEFLAFQKSVRYRDWRPRPPFEFFLTKFSNHAREVEQFLSENFSISPLHSAYKNYYNGTINQSYWYKLMKTEVSASTNNNVLETATEIILSNAARDIEQGISHLSFGDIVTLETLLQENRTYSRYEQRVLDLKNRIFAEGNPNYLIAEEKEEFLRQKPIL